MLGLCGSSGRSPRPHLHFHLQGTAALGAPTPLRVSSSRDGATDVNPPGVVTVVAARAEDCRAADVVPAGSITEVSTHARIAVHAVSATTRRFIESP